MVSDKSSIEIFKEEQRRFLFKKLQTLYIFLIILIFIPLVRLWYLQIIKGSYFNELSKNNVIKKVRLEPVRGLIYDRNFKLLVSNSPKYDVYIIPKDTETPIDTLKTLSKICNMDFSELITSYRKGYFSPFHPIKLIENIDKFDHAQIMERNLEIPGVFAEFRHKRFYPYNKLASQLLGYLGEISRKELRMEKYANFRGGDLIGTSGIERIFDDYLRGVPGSKYVKYDAKGQNLGDIDVIKNATFGLNLVLTLDERLQQAAEKLLEDKAGSVVILDPNNGDVLTIASGPGFDPNLFSTKISQKNWSKLQNDPLKPLQNKPIQGLYPPGSTFKIITALTALRKESFDRERVNFYCSGGPYLQDTFKCWNKWGHGKMDLHAALVNSCNTFFYSLERYITVNDLVQTSRDWLFGKLTGIDFPGEKAGFIPSPKWKKDLKDESWFRGETLSMFIGQGGILVTPVQVASFISALSNKGIFYKPRLLKSIVDWNGKAVKNFPTLINDRVYIGEEDLSYIKDALWGVVNAEGTGSKAMIPDYEICGKTGTAQVVSGDQIEEYEDDEIPYELRPHAWFAGFAPKDNPEIALCVMIEHGGGGGKTAAPIAKELFRTYFETKSQ